ncbi:MAG: hypothetical protein M3362_17435 [Acidobacteriota bacterium]|nr:hypothetical protein [Acidobacteriota bacterium]
MSLAEGLSYCNYCGAKLGGGKGDGSTKSTEIRVESFYIAVMVCLFILGTFAISALMGVMKAVLNLDLGQILAFTTLSFLIMLTLEGTLFWRLIHHTRRAKEIGSAEPPKGQTTKELDAAQFGMLPEAMPSVTEHTTRTFEPVYSKRKSE